MNLKKWSYLFWTTTCIGGAISLVIGLALQVFQGEMGNFRGPVDILLNVLQLILSGCMISVYSQMGFFAYLTLNYIAIGLFKKGWPYVQVLLTVIALLDLMFLRMLLGNRPEGVRGGGYEDIVLGIVVLVLAVVVSFWKVKATNATALIPTLFFMIAITTVETLSALNIGNMATWFVYIPLAICNAYQILMLHRLVGTAKS
ncbi:KinB signaling pathway activation protein [Paenibacillus sp. E194]|jgi:KinB signaling pathway activation protein|uniref:KinB signaling pathway activation protein n=1 Tax=Paenibacillus alvei TS-15 TaxID=1117108 RepID=S9SQL0_PAEAL|nr:MULTISPECIES: KinB-signaling pathway activation protein [Paenibacillus]EPY06984.1 KinB signaling pathway activation protein [Paenibacillus alvei TS-15]KJB87592.1 KinB signaling pathway activation protein [Paenibacillus sp. E194]